MSKRAYKVVQHLIFMVTFFVLAFALYMQYMGGLHPCPLCIMQRLCTFLIAIGCLMGFFSHTRSWARGAIVFQMVFAAAGVFFASRQLWLQSLPPDQVSACLPGLDVLIHYFPWHDVLFALFWGTGNCAEVTWTLLGLSMAAWAALYFLAIFVVCGLVFILPGSSYARFETKL